MNLSQNKSNNNSGNEISEYKKVPNENISYNSIITEDSIDDFFSIENIKGNKKLEINDFLDTFNLKEKEFKYHTQILLAQILKFLEKEDNSFKFLSNIEFKFGNTDKNKDIELDFTINNINSIHLSEILEYLKKIFLYSNFKEIYMKLINPKILKIIYQISKNSKISIFWEKLVLML